MQHRPAGDEDAQLRTAPQERLDQRRAGGDEMLAVVEHQQCPPGPERRHQRLGHRLGGALADAEDAGDRLGHEGRVAQGRQFDQPDAVRIGGVGERARTGEAGGGGADGDTSAGGWRAVAHHVTDYGGLAGTPSDRLTSSLSRFCTLSTCWTRASFSTRGYLAF